MPSEFIYNQSTVQAFYFFNEVNIDGTPIDSTDWVGAFNGDICVGARQWITSQCNEICEVPVMGDDGWSGTSGYMLPGDIPTFKIYDTSENSYYEAIPSENIPWAHNALNVIDYLEFNAFGDPDISVSPDSLYQELEAGESAMQNLTISNDGGSVLEWEITSDEIDGYYEDFEDGIADDWVETGSWNVENGVYIGQAIGTNTYSFYNDYLNSQVFEIDMDKTSGDLANVGVIINSQTQSNSYSQYQVKIVNDYGTLSFFAVIKYDNYGSYSFLSIDNYFGTDSPGWTETNDINQNGANHVKVVISSGYIDIYINDVYH